MLWRKAERELGMGVLFPSGRSVLCSTEDAVAGAVWKERGCSKLTWELGPEGPCWMVPSASQNLHVARVVVALLLCEMKRFIADFSHINHKMLPQDSLYSDETFHYLVW